MRLQSYALILAATFLRAGNLAAQQPPIITPVEAINRAAEAATNSEKVVRGIFEMVVRGTGQQDSLLFLNSEADYRDQRSLNVAILPGAQPMLQVRFGSDLLTALAGKKIRIVGRAQRVTIWFVCEGKRTKGYYFQTQIPIFRADQIVIVDE